MDIAVDAIKQHLSHKVQALREFELAVEKAEEGVAYAQTVSDRAKEELANHQRDIESFTKVIEALGKA